MSRHSHSSQKVIVYSDSYADLSSKRCVVDALDVDLFLGKEVGLINNSPYQSG